MRNTIFQPRQTLITADWLNAVDNIVFNSPSYALSSAGVPVGNGLTDESSLLKTAIANAKALLVANNSEGPIFVDLLGYNIGINSTIAIPAGVFLKNGKLLVTGVGIGTTSPCVSFSSLDGGGLYNVTIDAQWKSAGVLRNAATRVLIKDVIIRRFKTYGLKDTGTCTESKFSGTVAQYEYGDTGFNLSTNRDAYGIWSDSSDCLYTDFVSYYSKYPLYLTGSLNLFTTFHVYNGACTDAISTSIIRAETASCYGNVLTAGYYDNGTVDIVDAFQNSFLNGVCQRNANATSTSFFNLTTSTASSTGQGFVAKGLTFFGTYSGGYLNYLTSGAGTWTIKRISWDCIKADGTAAGTSIVKWSDAASISANGHLLVGTDSDIQTVGQWPGVLSATNASGFGAFSVFKYGTDAAGATLTLGKTRATSLGSYIALNSGDIVGRIAFGGDAGADYNQLAASIDCVTTGAWSGTSLANEIRFATTASGSTTRTSRFKLNDAGLQPFANNTYALGSGALQYSNVYSVAATFTGNVTLPGPYADDATAASNGITVGSLYKKTGGSVAWRVS